MKQAMPRGMWVLVNSVLGDLFINKALIRDSSNRRKLSFVYDW